MHPTTLAKAITIPLAIALSSCLATVRAKRADRVTHAIETAAPVSLDIETRNGAVTVEENPGIAEMQIHVDYSAGGRDEFEAEERVELFGLDITQGAGGTYSIRIDPPDGWQNGDGAKLLVTVPEAGAVRVRTSNGSISVQGASGEMVLDTSNGRVTTEGTAGELQVSTSNGSVQLQGHTGPLDAETSNGSMKLIVPTGCTSPFELETSNGSVRVELWDGWAGSVSARTSNGTIKHLSGGREMSKSKDKLTVGIGDASETSRIRTSNGSVTIEAR